MTLKRNAGFSAMLLLLPLVASAQELPSLGQFLVGLKAGAHAAAVPAAQAVATSQAGTPAQAPVDIFGDPQDGGPAMVSMVGGEPKGAYVYLTVNGDKLGAVYATPNQQETGAAIAYTFPDVDIAYNEILYHGTVIGRIEGSANRPYPDPVLNVGYSLKYSYGGTIDADTGADRAFVNVEIVSVSH